MVSAGRDEGFVKRVVCHACGAPKMTRSVTAFVYCDFCAALTDWDFQIACGDPRSKLPGPQYEAIRKELADDLAESLRARDRARYMDLQRRVFDAYVAACPASCPPRCGDPAYRARYVEYSAESATLSAFDAESAVRTEGLEQATKALAWTNVGGATKVESASFWRMYEAFVACMADPAPNRPHPSFALQHPDGAPVPLLRKMATSQLVQGWIPYLTEADTHALLTRTGLASEYVQPARIAMHGTSCGHCGGGLSVPEGAKRTLCERCGHVVDTGRGPLGCMGCGAKVVMPEGTNTFSCTFCKAELRAMRW